MEKPLGEMFMRHMHVCESEQKGAASFPPPLLD